MLSTEFVNYAVLYNWHVDKDRNETIYYVEVLTRLHNIDNLMLNNLKGKNEVFRDKQLGYPLNP